MPLTVSSDYFGDLARRRARAEQLRQTMSQASGTAIGALEKGGAAQTEQGNRDREALRLATARDDDLAQQRITNERNTQSDALALRIANENTERQREARGLAIEQDRRQAEADAQALAASRANSASAEKERARTEQLRAIDAAITAAGGDIDADTLANIITTTGAPEAVVRERNIALSRESSDRGLKRRKTEAEIDKLTRKPVVDPRASQKKDLDLKMAQAKLDALTARQNAPKEKALADVQAAEKKLAKLDEVIAESPKFNTGPLVDPALRAAGTILPESVYDPSDRNAWVAKVRQTYNATLKEMAGTAVSASEETRQLLAELNTTMDDATFDKIARDMRRSIATDIANAKQRLTANTRTDAAGAMTTTETTGDPELDAFLAGD